VAQGPYRAVGQALEVIPRTLAQNCGANVIRTLTKLRAKHAEQPGCTFGINGGPRRRLFGAREPAVSAARDAWCWACSSVLPATISRQGC
jgi:hypothetical protein